MTQPAEQVRTLLRVAADHLPGGPIGVPPHLLARVRHGRRRRRLQLAATFVGVLLVVGVPAVIFGGHTPPPAPLTGYSVPTVGAYPVNGPGGAAALAHGHWTRLPAAPIVGRVEAATVWTGKEMLVWGGASANGDKAYADGAGYDPSSGQWRILPPGPLSPRTGAAYVWSGRQLFIWGGYVWRGGQWQVADDGALYDPSTNSWQRVAASPLAARRDAITLWTGNAVVVIGGSPAVLTETQPGYLDAAAYDPRTNQWHPLAPLPTQPSRTIDKMTAAATPAGIDVWLYWEHVEVMSAKPPVTTETTSGISPLRLGPRSTAWQTIETAPPRDVGLPLWTGRELIFPATRPFYGYGSSGPVVLNTAGWRMNPSTESLRRLPHGPVDDGNADSLWTGAALISFNTTGSSSGPDRAHHPGEAAVWDPATNQWTRLPDAPFVSGEYPPSAIWTGSHLLEWGLMNPSRPDDAPPTNEVGLSFGP
jgi:hypothetical protein